MLHVFACIARPHPCNVFHRGDDLVLAGEVARNLRFSPSLVELADRVLDGVTSGGNRVFNGLHLRLENDAAPWIERTGGIKVWA